MADLIIKIGATSDQFTEELKVVKSKRNLFKMA